MAFRPLLPTFLLVAAVLAGCAQAPADEPAEQITAAQASALFAEAAQNMPARFGMHMLAEKDGSRLLDADGLFDKPANTTYLRLAMDPTLMAGAGGMMTGMMGDEITLYSTPDAAAILSDGTVFVTTPDNPYAGSLDASDSFDPVTDPGALLADFEEGGFNVTSVTPTTLRGKPAYQVDATVTQDGTSVPVSVWLFQEPARVGKMTMAMPAVGGDPMSGATMTMELLYDEEADVEVPASLTRALGLRYESNVPSFGGFSGFGEEGSGSSEPDEIVWTFQADGGIALSEITLQLDGEPWLKLSDLTAERDGATATFTDADGDSKVSAGDTLRITGAAGELALHDDVTGLNVVPGPGLLLGALALAGAALVLRRR